MLYCICGFVHSLPNAFFWRTSIKFLRICFTCQLIVSDKFPLVPLWQLVGDHDWCLPASMASGSQANLSSADGSASSRERPPGALRPSKGAEDVYAQARTLFRAMVQLPHYAEEVSARRVDGDDIYVESWATGRVVHHRYVPRRCRVATIDVHPRYRAPIGVTVTCLHFATDR